MIEQWLSSEWLYGGVSFHPGRVEIRGVGVITPATTDADLENMAAIIEEDPDTPELEDLRDYLRGLRAGVGGAA